MSRARVNRNVPAPDERVYWAKSFGVSFAQVDRDRAISVILSAIAPRAHDFVFYGGTALSRTALPELRLSEDIDLLSRGPRRPVAERLDEAIRIGTERVLGPVVAEPWLADARRDTESSLLHFGEIDVRI